MGDRSVLTVRTGDACARSYAETRRRSGPVRGFRALPPTSRAVEFAFRPTGSMRTVRLLTEDLRADSYEGVPQFQDVAFATAELSDPRGGVRRVLVAFGSDGDVETDEGARLLAADLAGADWPTVDLDERDAVFLAEMMRLPLCILLPSDLVAGSGADEDEAEGVRVVFRA